ncbi:hypothetical protein DKM19_26840 [Streptosporangium sp. 'caverna']|nr:hypothetical protein DKM19_26840 [Streptosporangium sp. 'caverna']
MHLAYARKRIDAVPGLLGTSALVGRKASDRLASVVQQAVDHRATTPACRFGMVIDPTDPADAVSGDVPGQPGYILETAMARDHVIDPHPRHGK